MVSRVGGQQRCSANRWKSRDHWVKGGVEVLCDQVTDSCPHRQQDIKKKDYNVCPLIMFLNLSWSVIL